MIGGQGEQKKYTWMILSKIIKWRPSSPVTVLNFAWFLLSSCLLSLLLFFPHFLLSLSWAPRRQALSCFVRSALLTESRRISSSKEIPGDDSRILLHYDSDEYSRRDALISRDGQRRVIKRRRYRYTLRGFLISDEMNFILFCFLLSHCIIYVYFNKCALHDSFIYS